MKRLLSLLVLLTTVSWCTWADETITVAANSEDISQALDLKAVATLFGSVRNVEEFETLLNNPDSAFTNLDLNGDGVVDYLRVVETSADNKHLVVIQAVLAKDVFQDVASIYVEKDEATGQVTTQVIGDEYIYGVNYVIEPVYIYRPYIYDWFWDPFWTCWASPWYWGFYPHWWHSWHCCPMVVYWDRCYRWHHHHPYCSFRYASQPRSHYQNMRHTVSHREYASRNADRSFSSRHGGRVTNARTVDATRLSTTRPTGSRSISRQGSVAATRVGQPVASHRPSATTTRTVARSQRPTTGTQQRSTTVTTRRPTATTATRSQRSTATTGQRSSATTTRTAAATTRTAPTATRSSATTSRSTATTSRSSSASRASSSSGTRSSGSYGGSRSSGSSTRSSGSYGGGSRSGGGGYSSGGSFGGGSRSGGGGHSSGGGGGRSSTRR